MYEYLRGFWVAVSLDDKTHKSVNSDAFLYDVQARVEQLPSDWKHLDMATDGPFLCFLAEGAEN